MASQIQNLLQQTLGEGARSSDFEVNFFGGGFNKLNDQTILVKSTSLPTRTHEIIDFKYRGRSIPLRGQTKFGQTWECTFYVTADHSNRLLFEGLLESLDYLNRYSTNYDQILSSYDNKIMIYQKDFNDNKSMTYTLHNVFPIEIGNVTYDYSQPDVILELPVTFAYSHYEMTPITVGEENSVTKFINGVETKIKSILNPNNLVSNLKSVNEYWNPTPVSMTQQEYYDKYGPSIPAYDNVINGGNGFGTYAGITTSDVECTENANNFNVVLATTDESNYNSMLNDKTIYITDNSNINPLTNTSITQNTSNITTNVFNTFNISGLNNVN